MASTNGHAPDPLAPLRAYAEQVAASSREHAAALKEELQGEQALQAEIKRLLSESQTRERNMRKAVEVLTGEAPAKRQTNAKTAHGWTISQSKVQQVWDEILRREGHFRNADLRALGLSGEAVRRSLQILREQELIRVAGKTRGGGNAYALMPGAQEHREIVLAADGA